MQPQMLKMKNQKINSHNKQWEKVYVVCGDPLLSRLFIQGIQEDLNTPSKRTFDKGDSPKSIVNALKAFVMFDTPDMVVIYDPSAEQMRTIESFLDAEVMTASALVIATLGDLPDGRSKFIQKAEKCKRVFFMSPIEYKDTKTLRAHLLEWAEDAQVSFDKDAINWVLSNAPACVGKIKSSSGKKDCEVYDLQSIENELEKIKVINSLGNYKICVADLEKYVRFDYYIDIWSFINVAISNGSNAGDALKMIQIIANSQGTQAALILLASQIEFLLCIKSLQNRNIQKAEAIAEFMSMDSYLGRYLLPDWTEINEIPTLPKPNAWRIRKAIESPIPSTERLSLLYQSVLSAIRDLRSGLDERIVLPYLALCLGGHNSYITPLKQ